MPAGTLPAVYPFQSWVLNLNVATKAHRDRKDYRLCLVIPVGRFKGGELCMVETGLILEIQSGDVAVFPSSDITHFNLHFKGKLFYFSSDFNLISFIQAKGHLWFSILMQR